MASCGSVVSRSIRKVQVAEVLRSAINRAQGASSISVRDIDDLALMHNVRPSLTIGAVEVIGGIAGTALKYAPASVSSFVGAVVDEAVQLQFNDSIRDLSGNSADEGRDDEIRSTLKFHRDFSSVESVPSTSRGRLYQASVGGLSSALNLTERL